MGEERDDGAEWYRVCEHKQKKEKKGRISKTATHWRNIR